MRRAPLSFAFRDTRAAIAGAWSDCLSVGLASAFPTEHL